ncbi:MAG TPA: hypothetical protein VIB79_06185 [Candidatus Binatia bacterium]|jgi:hypothetical protein
MKDEHKEGPETGDRAPEFMLEVAGRMLPLGELASRRQKLILTSQDSYRYHPN